MKKRIKLIILTSLCIILSVMTAWGVPGIISYQGKLTDPRGVALDGTYDMIFSIFDSASGGNLLWSENQSSVVVTEGIYNVALGSIHPIPADIFDSDDLYFQVSVYNAGTSEYEPLSPRQQLTSVAFSMKCADSDALNGYGSKDFMHVGDKATGDLYGHYPAPIVAGLGGRPISPAAPSKGQVLKYDGSAWKPDKDADSGGDITRVIAGDGLTGGAYSGVATLAVKEGGITSSHILNGTITADDIADDSITSDNINGVSWDKITSKPAGFSDNIDNDTKYSAGNGLELFGNTFSVKVPLSLTGSVWNTGILKGVNGDPYGIGVYGGGYIGVYGLSSEKGDYTNYGGHFRASGDRGRGVYGFADATGDVTNYGGYFKAAGMSGRAVFGEATNNGSVENYGGYFQADGESGVGVYGNSPYKAVYGESTAITGTSYGGYFKTSSASGIGVYGAATHEGDALNYGGHFSASGDRGVGVYAEGSGHAGYFQGDVFISGNLFLAGSKSFVLPHPTDPTRQIVYVCLEGGENGVYVRGSGELKNGRARVQLPEHFSLVASETGLTAQVTPRDGSAGSYLYVEEVTRDHIKVVEANGGTSNARFDYLVMGIRAGYEHYQVIQENTIGKGIARIDR